MLFYMCILYIKSCVLCVIILGITPSADSVHGRIRYFVESCSRLFNHTKDRKSRKFHHLKKHELKLGVNVTH